MSAFVGLVFQSCIWGNAFNYKAIVSFFFNRRKNAHTNSPMYLKRKNVCVQWKKINNKYRRSIIALDARDWLVCNLFAQMRNTFLMSETSLGFCAHTRRFQHDFRMKLDRLKMFWKKKKKKNTRRET